MSGAMAGRSAGQDGNKGRIETTKVKRYRPGQVPEWMQNREEDTDLQFGRQAASQEQPTLIEGDTALRRTGVAAPIIVKKADDPRLARLAAVQPTDRTAALRERHAAHAERDIAAPQIVRRRERPPSSDEEEEEKAEKEEAVARRIPSFREPEVAVEGEDAEDAIAARRAALRAKLQEEERVAAEAAEAQKEEESDEEDEDSSEYETDSEEEDYLGHRPLAKPVFVPKMDRETVAERAALEKEIEEEAERQRIRLEQRKEETKELVAAKLAEEEAQEAAAAAGPKGAEDVITDDEAVDEEEEYNAWKLREMKRIGRDREEREREAKEAEERERWKNMTEEERMAYLAAQPKVKPEKEKKKFGFLQKYYHRGAFFQTEAEWKGEAAPLAGLAQERDYTARTGEDRMDRAALPEVMQVKNFGKKGRSKWTHLAAEDTTDFDAPWVQNPAIRKKHEARLAGTEQVFTRPKNMKT